MLAEIETAIVSQLGQLQGWSVCPFPDNPDELGKPTLSRQVFVGFRRETMSEPSLMSPVAPVTQQRSVEYEILLKSKDLRSHQGVYRAIDAVRDALTGFVPIPQAKGMYETSAQFIDAQNGIWMFGMTFSVRLNYQKRRV